MSVRSALDVCVGEAKLFLALTQHQYVKLSEHALIYLRINFNLKPSKLKLNGSSLL